MMATVIKFLTPLLPQIVRYPHEGTTLSRAIGQISVSFHRRHQPWRPVNHHKFDFYIALEKVAKTLTCFQIPAKHWPTAFNLFPQLHSAVLSDVQAPKTNVSPAWNYPQCPHAVSEEWKGLTSFWPSATLRFLSHPSPSPDSSISNSSLRGLSVLVSLCEFVSSMCKRSLLCNVCTFICVSVTTIPSSNIFICRIFPVSLVAECWRMSSFTFKSLNRL